MTPYATISDNPVYSVSVLGEYAGDAPRCIAAFLNVHDAAHFVSLCGIRTTIDVYDANALQVKGVVVIEPQATNFGYR